LEIITAVSVLDTKEFNIIMFVPPPPTTAGSPPVEYVPEVNAGTIGDDDVVANIFENSATVPFLAFQPGIGKKLDSTLSV
jgi:hypothetical protein